MSQTVKITCPRCQHAWETTLQSLEEVEIIYKSVTPLGAENKPVTKYRARCPVDGTYIILEIEED